MDVKARVDQYDFVGTWEHSPSGAILVQRDFFCIRCAAIQRFSVSKKEIAARLEHQTDAILVEIKAMQEGWILNTARIEGKSHEYILCPACVAEDFKRFHNYHHLIALEK